MRRVLDLAVSGFISVVTLPLVLVAALLVVLHDGGPPLYIAPRVGRGGRTFRMYKLRSMVHHADRSGVDSTAADDPRLTTVGRRLRALKLDELPQLWNVLRGDMALIGPRPNVEREVRLYTEEERRLLDVRPGITDLASIAFADYEQILRGTPDPDIAYNQRIRPWKSRLSLLGVYAPRSIARDVRVLGLTVLATISRERAIRGVARIVRELGGDEQLCRIAAREVPLEPAPPPGTSEIVVSRVARSSPPAGTLRPPRGGT